VAERVHTGHTKRSAGVPEELEPLGEELTVRPEIFAPRNDQLRPLEPLQPMQQHWSVFLTQDIFSDLDPQIRPDPQHLAVERGVVERTQRQSIRNEWQTARMSVGQNMRGVKQLAMVEPADTTGLVVRKQGPLSKGSLVKALLDLGGDVPTPSVRAEISWCSVHVRKCTVVSDNGEREMLVIVVDDEHRPDRFVSTRHDSIEVRKRCPAEHR
jgi:hypothetical protein